MTEDQAKRCLVSVQPQQWIFDQATDSDHPFEVDVTAEVLAMGREEALKIKDSTDESDTLVEGLFKDRHNGPYYVTCEEAIAEFFGEEPPL
jgi:hypothetical protein